MSLRIRTFLWEARGSSHQLTHIKCNVIVSRNTVKFNHFYPGSPANSVTQAVVTMCPRSIFSTSVLSVSLLAHTTCLPPKLPWNFQMEVDSCVLWRIDASPQVDQEAQVKQILGQALMNLSPTGAGFKCTKKGVSASSVGIGGETCKNFSVL